MNATWWCPGTGLRAFVKHSVSIGREEGVRICSFGHAATGNLHLYICQDGLKDAVWTDVVERVMERLYAQARELGGEVSGEHGIGMPSAPSCWKVQERARSISCAESRRFLTPTAFSIPARWYKRSAC